MKRLILFLLIHCFAGTVLAQTLELKRGAITTCYDVKMMGEATLNEDATQLTIDNVNYNVADIEQMLLTDKEVSPLTVNVNYDNSNATVTLSGDLAPYLNIQVNGADVSISADEAFQQEITYNLYGNSPSGSFTMEGDFKACVTLNDLTLTSTTLNMPAINVLNGKRIAIEVNGTNTFEDIAGGNHKGAFFINGHAEFKGEGTLRITGRTKHAYASDEYTEFKKSFTGKVEVLAAEGDAFHIDQYLLMKSGTLTMHNVKGDGIDVSYTNEATDEFNGQVFIEGGVIELDVAADDTKGLASDSLMTISGGTIKGTVSGNGTKGISAGNDLLVNEATGKTLIDLIVTGTTYAPGTLDESKCRGIKGKGDFTFDGGTILISATGVKSKAISIDGTYYYVSGSLNCAVDDN